MLGGNGIRGWFANRSIGSKIGVGFAAVLAILAVSSAAAWLSFGRVNQAVDSYAQLVATSAIYRDIDRAVTAYRGHVREYIFSDNEDAATAALADAKAVRELIATGL